MTKPIQVGNRFLGPESPCFLVAEIGINHNGDTELARRTIDAAIAAGADAVKFQNYATEDFLSDRSLTYEYISQGKPVIEAQYDMFKRCELTVDDLSMLYTHCEQRGIIFFSTPTSKQGITDLVTVGVPLLKNGSDYLVNLPLIQAMAQTGIPTVLSTGMATLAEIDDAVRAFRETGGKELVLLHCTSSYPTPAQDVNLRKISTLKSAFGCPIGFSDHTDGIVAGVGAISLGACIIEKHFTLDKALPGPDHWFSSDPAEFRTLVSAVRTMEQNLGTATVGPTPSETEGRLNYRLSCVAADALSEGHRLTEQDIAFHRPGTGLPPKAIEWLVGRRLSHNIPKGTVFDPSNFA